MKIRKWSTCMLGFCERLPFPPNYTQHSSYTWSPEQLQ